MIQVPRYDSPKVQSERLPQANFQDQSTAESLNVGASSQALMEAKQKVVKQLTGIALEAKKEADESAVMAVTNQVDMLSQGMLYGSGIVDPDDPRSLQKGVYARKGLGVIEGHEKDKAYWDEQTSKLLSLTNNDVQKHAVQKQISQAWNSFDHASQAHAASEIRKHSEAQTEARIDLLQQGAALNFSNQAEVEKSLLEQYEIIAKKVESGSIPEEQSQVEINNARGKTIFGVVNRFLDAGDFAGAQKAYESSKKEGVIEEEGVTIIGGDDPNVEKSHGIYTDNIEKSLKAGTEKGLSINAASEIVRTSKNELEAIQKVEKISDPFVKDSARTRVSRYYEDIRSAKKAQEDALFQSVTNQVRKLKNLDSIPVSTLSALSPSQQSQLDELTRKLQKGESTVLDKAYYAKIQNLANDPSKRDEFIAISPEEMVNKLDASTYKEMIKKQAAIKAKDPETLSSLDGAFTQQQVISKQLKINGLSPKGNPKDYAQAEIYINDQISELQKTNNRKATSKEINQIVTDALLKVKTDTTWFGSDVNTPKFKLSPEKMKELGVKPQSAESDKRERAINFLKNKGKKASEANIKKIMDVLK